MTTHFGRLSPGSRAAGKIVRVAIGASFGDAARDEIAELAQRATFDRLGEEVVDARHLDFGERLVDIDKAVLDRAVLEHEYSEQLAFARRNESELRERP